MVAEYDRRTETDSKKGFKCFSSCKNIWWTFLQTHEIRICYTYMSQMWHLYLIYALNERFKYVSNEGSN